jgi:hypothetical protein
MLSGDFQLKLRRLNPKLRIFCGEDVSKPAGICHKTQEGDYDAVCGIDKNWIPSFPIRNTETGKFIKGGWVRAVSILCDLRLIDRYASYKEFGHWDYPKSIAVLRGFRTELSAVDKEIEYQNRRAHWDKDTLVDVGRAIAKRREK